MISSQPAELENTVKENSICLENKTILIDDSNTYGDLPLLKFNFDSFVYWYHIHSGIQTI